ncbi:MAG: branched-chain amino acid ABC transporter permease [Haloferacaceae archaeon]
MAVADTLVSLGVLVSFYSLVALGLNIKYGHTGLLDFGHVAFYLIGAYTAALFVLPPDVLGMKYLFGLNMPWVVAALVGAFLAGIVGAFVALPTLRLREDYLAITLLGVSVILQRVVQAESWLVNGPDALRGINQPFSEVFPLTGGTVAGALMSFLFMGGLWALGTYALGRSVELDGGTDGLLAGRLHAVATLGIGRIIEAQHSDNPGYESRALTAVADLGRNTYVGTALVAGVGVGVIAGAATLTGREGLLAAGTAVAAFTWIVIAVSTYRWTADFGAINYVITLALGTGYMLGLAPVYLLESDVTGIPLTFLAFGIVIGVTYYLWQNWSRFQSMPFRYGIMTGLWFGLVWYFPLQILSNLRNGALGAAATTLFNNLVWVLTFSGPVPSIGYSRFLLVLFGIVTLGTFYVAELIVESPFGRVLRAIRNDELVVNSLGKDPFMFKVQSMAVGSAIGGLGGALAAMYFQTLVFTMFAPTVTFIALLIMFLGGVANNRAMIVGAALFWAFQIGTVQLAGFVSPILRTRVQAFRLVVMGVLFLLLLYYRPEGIMGERSATGVEGESE